SSRLERGRVGGAGQAANRIGGRSREHAAGVGHGCRTVCGSRGESRSRFMNAQQRAQIISTRQEVIDKRTHHLWRKGDWQDIPVYRVPVDALLLNIDNRRFAAERTLFEEELGHPLDPENSAEDEQSVMSILLDSNLHVDGGRVTGKPSADTVALKADW